MFFIELAIALALQVVSYLLTPKPKKTKPPAAQDAEGPTAEAGRPIPVIFGTVTVKGLNVLWFGETQKNQYQVKV